MPDALPAADSWTWKEPSLSPASFSHASLCRLPGSSYRSSGSAYSSTLSDTPFIFPGFSFATPSWLWGSVPVVPGSTLCSSPLLRNRSLHSSITWCSTYCLRAGQYMPFMQFRPASQALHNSLAIRPLEWVWREGEVLIALEWDAAGEVCCLSTM